MTPLALLLSLSVATSPPVLVAVSTQGFTDKDRAAVVARVTADVEGAGVVPMALPPGVVTPACAADPACARTLFSGGAAERLVVVDVLRAGSRASVSARVVDRAGATVAEHAGVVPMARLLAGHEPLLQDPILAELAVAAPTPPAPVTSPPPPTTTAPTTTAPTTTTAPPPTTTVAPPVPAPAAGAPQVDPSSMAIIGVGVGAIGALFLIGGSAAALGQNAVRLDASADGAAREATALTIPLSLGVAVLGAVGVGAGIVMLLGEDDAPAVPGAGG